MGHMSEEHEAAASEGTGDSEGGGAYHCRTYKTEHDLKSYMKQVDCVVPYIIKKGGKESIIGPHWSQGHRDLTSRSPNSASVVAAPFTPTRPRRRLLMRPTMAALITVA